MSGKAVWGHAIKKRQVARVFHVKIIAGRLGVFVIKNGAPYRI